MSLHSTTILCIKKDGKVQFIADGQVTLGESVVIKSNAKKLRKLCEGKVVVGYAGSVADCLTMIDRLERKFTEHSEQLMRSVIELIKEWRTDRTTRSLNASLIVADKTDIVIIGGDGTIMEAEEGIASIGSGSMYAISAAKALIDLPNFSAKEIALKSMNIASDLCVFTNKNYTFESIE